MTSLPQETDAHEDRRITTDPEEYIFMAMGAYDNLGRNLVMKDRGDLTKSQVDALVGLYVFESMNMTQISEHLAVSNEQASRAIAPLVERGLVERSRDDKNLRKVNVSLTDQGKRYLAQRQEALHVALREKLAVLSRTDLRALLDASRIAERILRKIR